MLQAQPLASCSSCSCNNSNRCCLLRRTGSRALHGRTSGLGRARQVRAYRPWTLCARSTLMQSLTVMGRGKDAPNLVRFTCVLHQTGWAWRSPRRTALCRRFRQFGASCRLHGAGYAGPAAIPYQSTQTAQPAYAAFQPSQQQQQQTQPSTQQQQPAQQQGQPQPSQQQQQLYTSPEFLAAAATHQAGLYALQGGPPYGLAHASRVTVGFAGDAVNPNAPCKWNTRL